MADLSNKVIVTVALSGAITNKKMNPNYHLNKTNLLKEIKNIHLIHIFESEWHGKQEQVKEFIRSKVNVGIKISAHNCEIKYISVSDAECFTNKHNLLGWKEADFCIGLFYKNELIQVACVKNKELILFTTKSGLMVYGGISKISKYLFNIIGEFVTFVDYRLSDENSFLKSGFVYELLEEPEYRLLNNNTGKMVNKEFENKKIKQFKVYDCGRIKMIFRG